MDSRPTQGGIEMKHDKQKYKPSLTYTSLLKEISKVRNYGKEKYGSYDDWRTTETIRHLNAAIRHIRDVIEGEDFDRQSHFLHLGHAATNIMFEIERIREEAMMPPNEETRSTCVNCGQLLKKKKR